ncbi:MAG: PAS domain S-box protein [Gemmataceae bacterium]
MLDACRPDAELLPTRKWLTDLLVTMLFVGLALIFRQLINNILGPHAPFLPFLFAVVLASWYAGWWSGLVATLLGALLSTVFFLQIEDSVSHPHLIRGFWFGMFVAVGGIISWLSETLHRARRDVEKHLLQVKQAERNALASEQRFREAIEEAPVPIMLHAENGAILAISRAWLEITGYTREELQTVEDWLTRAYTPQELPRVREVVAQLYHHKGRRDEGEFAVQTRWPGQVRIWDFSSSSLDRLPDGSALIISMAKDVTDRVKVEQEIHRLQKAVEAAASGIVITDVKGTILWCNQAFTRMTQYTPTEAIGQNPRVLKSGKHSEEFYHTLWQTIQRGEVWRGHLHNRRKDGSYYDEEMTITPVFDAAGTITHFIAIKQDISERLHLEDQLRQAQKMEAIGRLAGGVAHDFNNLLTVISGFSELVLNTLPPSDPRRESLKLIRDAGERATGLTRQLLAFSRKLVIEPTLLDLHTILQDTEKMLRRLIGEDIVLSSHLAAQHSFLQIDPGQLVQILLNLAVNSRDAMPKGGQLTFRTSNVDVGGDQASIYPDVKPGLFLRLSVCDTGCGMTEEVMQRIFEPFFTTKEVGQGTGLGLPTVHAIVQQAGGFVQVESEPGQGTTFHLHFPVVLGQTAPQTQATLPPNLRGNETILFVEDDAAVLNIATVSLESYGYKVITATSGETALEILKNYKGSPIQLLATDMIMPGMDGRELVEKVLQQKPGLRVLFMSGYTDDVILRKGVAQHTHAFLHKPYTPFVLVRKVRELLDRR